MKLNPISASVNSTIVILCCVFSVIIFLFSTSCSSSTASKTGSLSGSIILQNDTGDAANDAVDFAGVTVALYKTATLDTTIVRINGQYPGLGVQINQQTEFDHRLQAPSKVTTTSANGSFKLSKINKGMYNLVVYKEGWGIRYFYNLDIEDGSNNINSLLPARSSIALYPERVMSGYVLEPFTFLSNHSYIVDNNLSFVNEVIMQPSANVLIKPNMRITLLSSINTSQITEGYCAVTSADKIYTTTQQQSSQILNFDGIYGNPALVAVNNKIHSLITSFTSNGWNLQSSNFTIENSVFRYCTIGLQLVQCENVIVTGCNSSKSVSVEMGGMTFTGCNKTQVLNSIFTQSTIGLRQHTSAETTVSNCIFYANTSRDVFNLYETTGLIEYCDFGASNIAIETSGESNTNIQRCNIQAKTGIFNSQQFNWNRSYFQANFNNLLCTVLGIKSSTLEYTGVIKHFDCKHNYWYTTNQAEINDLTWDMDNEDPNIDYYERYLGVVDNYPINYSFIQDAGIISTTK